ncbi:MAG TPA: linear amide C-N hydrolase [Burkholderiales bacterium]|nr:linear amide C-N hydrolase [Burkholderiales bacterium]
MKIFYEKIKIYYILIFFLFISNSFACTDVQIIAKDHSTIIGRTMDFAIETKPKIKIFPRNQQFFATAPDNSKSFQWNNKYAYLAIIVMGDNNITPDGINEKGLTLEYLWLPETQYINPQLKDYKKYISNVQLAMWILGNFSSVRDVKKAISNVNVWGESIAPIGIAPIHIVLHDKDGKSIVIEFIKGKTEIYDNLSQVVTNSPTYDWHLTNLRNYISLTNQNYINKKIDGKTILETGNGNGFFGIPGDYTPPSRFIKTVAISYFADKPINAISGVILMSHILNNVDIPLGTIQQKTTHNMIFKDYTQWSVIKDITNMNLYIKDYNSLGYAKISLTELFNSTRELKSLEFSTFNTQNNIDKTNNF